MIRATIDLGTNTCLLLLVDWDPFQNDLKKIVGDFSKVVRLGEGVDQKRQFQVASMERTLSCLKDYSEKVKNAGGRPEDVICVATSQARDAKNSQDFFSKVQIETGFHFQVISGKDEARYTYLGALLPGMDPNSSSVIDIGGGSTEIISLEGAQSIDIGSVRFTERFFESNPVTDSEFWACQNAIDLALQPFLSWRKKLALNSQLVAVAGTATSLAAWHLALSKFDSSRIDQVVLTRGDIHRMVEELKWRSLEERKALPAMEPMRADVILAGALILWRVHEVLSFSECKVSTRGLRFGLLKKFLSRP